ncbi:hypothetical protein NDU88_004576 [Pleurodeles waltl]|uniref:Uncharacterized protein n=1 Tax=Pleurodeles waltl TaxID=8319 RepID=A0AAV7NK27_PLEWA|nr:hypothetical protein NDU88_004576 [Pleurodeles waltl]
MAGSAVRCSWTLIKSPSSAKSSKRFLHVETSLKGLVPSRPRSGEDGPVLAQAHARSRPTRVPRPTGGASFYGRRVECRKGRSVPLATLETLGAGDAEHRVPRGGGTSFYGHRVECRKGRSVPLAMLETLGAGDAEHCVPRGARFFMAVELNAGRGDPFPWQRWQRWGLETLNTASRGGASLYGRRVECRKGRSVPLAMLETLGAGDAEHRVPRGTHLFMAAELNAGRGDPFPWQRWRRWGLETLNTNISLIWTRSSSQ